jgi:YVTN family beta-propeller protein
MPRLAEVDTTTPPNVSSIGVGVNPLYAGYDDGNGYVYVSNQGACSPCLSNVSVIDGTAAIGSVIVGEGPGLATFNPRNDYVYVPNAGSNNVSVINGTQLVGSVGVGGYPTQASYDPKNGYVYVPNAGSDNVSVINGTGLVGSVEVGTEPVWTTYDDENGYVYVTNYGSANVSVIDGTTLLGSVKVGSGPASAISDSEDGYVYIVNSGFCPCTSPGTVSVINGTMVIASVRVGIWPWVPAFDSANGDVYVPNVGVSPYTSPGTVSVINGTERLGSLTVGSGPVMATYDPGNGFIYVTNDIAGSVSEVNGTEVIGSVSVGVEPNGAWYDSGNGYVYVPNEASNNVSAIFTGAQVRFTESGLPKGTGWWINITGGPSTYSRTTTLTFGAADGVSSYSAATTDKTYSSPGGSFMVTGGPASVTVPFLRVTYPVTFTSEGLPNGTNWSVTIGGITRASMTNTIAFAEPNGTHVYLLGVVSGWTTTNSTGTAAVAGRGVFETVVWTRVTYTVTVEEIGLPLGTGWWLNVTGSAHVFSNTNTVTLTESNGTYWYSTSAADKTYAAPVGSFTVNGPPAFARVAFSLVTYPVTFLEVGLSDGTTWSVGLYSTQQTSTSTSIAFAEPNGTYSFLVSHVPGYTESPSYGTVTVSGVNLTETITFTAIAPTTYVVSFSESGLPGGTEWSVTLGGRTTSGTGTLAFEGILNGTYTFSVSSVAGYSATPNNGSVIVSGHSALQSIAFSSSSVSSPRFLGLPGTEGYGVVGGILVAIVVGVAVVALLKQRGKGPPERPKSRARPAAAHPPGQP